MLYCIELNDSIGQVESITKNAIFTKSKPLSNLEQDM